ncbi:MAG TPA: tRNA pseudouridine(38-40) synthase TruA [Candidatus Dormibacteraeota bacterium]|nr:tRNA pseudouridine(38-40) synthase TruA [Candidatus Dormibacteraeota bacterium]
MSTYRLTLEYDGSAFSGWQRQPRARTVEGALREALAVLSPDDPAVTAAGRTDAGAHAHGQVAGVQLAREWEPERLRAALNALLPDDVVVVHAASADAAFNARRDALRRTYRYMVQQRDTRAAVTRRHAWQVRGPLDVDAMRATARHLLGTHDFAGFGRATRPGGSTVRTVHEVDVEPTLLGGPGETEVDVVVITVTADAFLRGMMRAFAGALVEVGRGRMAIEHVAALVDSARSEPRLPVAPAHGLHQWAVQYPVAA